jgi:hypothetical protein
MREKLINFITHIQTLLEYSELDWTIAYDPDTRYYHIQVGVKKE